MNIRYPSTFVLGLLMAQSASAGIIDSPLPPNLFGSTDTPKMIYAVTGLRTNGADVSAVIQCTNTGSADATLAVEFFSSAGAVQNDVTGPNGVRSVEAGRTVTISADSVADGTPLFVEDEIADLLSDLGPGSARILAAGGSKFICSAHVVDDVNSESYTVPVFAKGKQKGD